MELEGIVFAVLEDPYCLWEANLAERNRFFLEGLDPEHFDYMLHTHDGNEDEVRALVATKHSLHHATEAMFTLLGAFTQAPKCAYAWIAKCSTPNLRELVRRISAHDGSIIAPSVDCGKGWEGIAESIFATYMPGTERQQTTIKGFARFWRTMSAEFDRKESIDEHNALKHGFRARRGGFFIRIGEETTYGVPPPAEAMKSLEGSKFGATFLTLQTLASGAHGPHLVSQLTSVNWSATRVRLQLHLVSMSLLNVVAALRIANGTRPEECTFTRPVDDSDFLNPWKHFTGVNTTTTSVSIDPMALPKLTKAQLVDELRTKTKRGR